MRSSVAALALAASVSATNFDIVWQHAKDVGTASLTVLNGSQIVAQSCSSVISGSPASIDFSMVDPNGSGFFQVGEKRFQVHENKELSGGPVCTRKYNNDAAVVECSGVSWDASASQLTTEDCHATAELKSRSALDYMAPKAKRSMHLSLADPIRQEQALAKRGPPECHFITTTGITGNGNPHQNFLHRQLSETISCNQAQSCSAGQFSSRSYSIEWSAGATAYGWLSGGFAVQMSWETGNNYECQGGPGQTVCLWYSTAHTAYTVHNAVRNTCEGGGWRQEGGDFVMWSPNQTNRGGGHYCVVGSCRSQGDGYWDYNGRAGGP